MSSTVICISASDGAKADEVATAVGEALGFRVINEEIVARAAAEAGVDQQAIEDVEQRKTALTKILDLVALWGASTPEFYLSADPQLVEGIPGVATPYTTASTRQSEALRDLIRSAIDEFMAAGEVVLLAHAASQSLAGRDHVLRVLVTASPPTRSARLAESLEIPAKKADALVKNGDAGRADYLKRFYGIDNELPTHYDIVVNTDKLTPEESAAAIVSLASPVAGARS
ncbi:MAG TPA: cytidylate kinase-like family protein [Solirubrobacteraceae bacterium]|jgi:cytidylate kinase|nr:cytidylate kinase-like family protein [Solirubrobacteraceae bacterium]